ncbi:UV-damage endonuclease [Venturia nashicola]|uniref:non-specific serine/threonine protein kinase n=1 Tax=Venturia nashicola TaxID=86259 RepID=A0A4Z1PPA5_9PEZI|nr:UV-damage endonuclease [Venturia nashicola]TLD36765.1 UV-damage endonuclease [Venturia nashicola]
MARTFKELGFFPTYVGQIYNGKYVVLRKLGSGTHGCVWLVVNIHTELYHAMKVLGSGVWVKQRTGRFNEIQILEILRVLSPGSPTANHPGLRYIPELLDGFMVSGSTGKHFCLVLDVMGETLSQFASRFPDHKIPVVLVKRFAKQLLLALELAHGKGVIHTDIKPDNIMIPLMDRDSTIKAWLHEDTDPKTKPFFAAAFKGRLSKATNGSTVGCEAAYPRVDIWSDTACFDRFGRKHGIDSKWRNVEPDDHLSWELEKYHRRDLEEKTAQEIAEDPAISKLNVQLMDWGLARWSDPKAPRTFPQNISAELFRSPEVVLGACWTSKTDIWSLGVTLIELLGGVPLFDNRGKDNKYDELQHIYEMTFPLWKSGIPFPLLDQARKESRKPWVLDNLDDLGLVCRYPYLNRRKVRWRDPLFEVPGGPFEGDREDHQKYFSFITNMIQLDPAVRSSAEQLLKEPWLEGV